MKKLLFAVTTAAALLAVPAALAMPVDGVTASTYAAKAFCPYGQVIIYATQNVSNSADFGETGLVWALDNYQRVIMVEQITPTTFCASVTYVNGKFTTTGTGPSPALTQKHLRQGIQGIVGAGYRTGVFTGVLRPDPQAPYFGSFSSDYGCGTTGSCPGYVDWTSLYFSSTTGFAPNWWSYAYTSQSNGTWVQRADFSYGDITN
jgi:hypothetical protein